MQILLDAGPSGRGWHRLELVLQCPQKYGWTYGGAPASSEGAAALPSARIPTAVPLIKGSLLHIGLAHHYARVRQVQHGLDPDLYFTPEEAVMALARKFSDAGDTIAFDLSPDIYGALAGYRLRYPFEDFEVLHVEEVFATQIAGYPFTGRYDLVVREKDGKIWIWDHKSSFKLDDETSARYAMSGQFLAAQAIGREQWGDSFGGVKLNLIAMTAPFKYARKVLDPAPWAVQQFKYTVEEAEGRIERFRLLPQNEWPKTASEQVCTTQYGKCKFFDRCRWGK